jgi:hypothetical protein
VALTAFKTLKTCFVLVAVGCDLCDDNFEDNEMQCYLPKSNHDRQECIDDSLYLGYLS